MNKTIKFRVWLDDFLQYVYPHTDKYIYYRGNVVGLLWTDVDETGIVCKYYNAVGKRFPDCATLSDTLSEFSKYTIEVYTGLTDSASGREIYEGDILHYYFNNEIDRVITDTYLICSYEPSNAWYVFCEEDAADDDGYYWTEIKHNCYVFGNIHENAIPSS